MCVGGFLSPFGFLRHFFFHSGPSLGLPTFRLNTIQMVYAVYVILAAPQFGVRQFSSSYSSYKLWLQ